MVPVAPATATTEAGLEVLKEGLRVACVGAEVGVCTPGLWVDLIHLRQLEVWQSG